MATVSLSPSCNGLRDNGLTEIGIPPSKTALADEKLELECSAAASRWRCDSVCMERTPICDSSPQSTSRPQIALSRDIRRDVGKFELLDLAPEVNCLSDEPPPPYTAAVVDAPPCYETLQLTTQYLSPQNLRTLHVQHRFHVQWHAKLQTPTPPIYPMKPVEINFDDTSTFRQAAKKAAHKKAQKQADQAKGADDGGEGANEGGEGGDDAGGGGGGGGGGSHNGDGGAGDDGGGGDEWNFGGGKKSKKKGKKGKNAVDEEEEEKKEEEGKKGDGTNGANDLSWMDDTAAKPDDDWGGFTSTDKKGKKSKKGKAEAVPEPTFNAFEDINLGGDQLDLNFGNTTGMKGSDPGFGFGAGAGAGGFGSSWDTGNNWGFGGLGNGVTDITNSTKDTSGAADDTGAWAFGKKNKKTTTTSGFDFEDFATLDEDGEIQADAGGDQDDWATGLTASGKKNKKSKKSAIEESSTATDTTAIGTAVTDPTTADDSWSPWGTSSSKKDKNKKKKNEPEPSDIPPVPPPPPPVPEEPHADDTWGSFGAKSKKKNKKGAAEEPVKVDEPIVVVPEPEPEADAGWGSFGAKKEKKKGKKDAADDKKSDPDPMVVVGDSEAGSKPENNTDWGFSTKKDKDKKKGKKGVEEDKPKEAAIVEVPEKEDDLDLGWGGFGTSKDKKKGKTPSKTVEPAATVIPEPEPEADMGWGGFGLKKEKKKGKKAIEEAEPHDDDIVAIVTDPDPVSSAGWGFGTKKDKKKSKTSPIEDLGEDSHVVKIPDLEPVVEDSFDSSWGTTTTKKGKKDKKGGIAEVKEDTASVIGSAAAAEAATKVADDDWMNWGSADKKKDKKSKKGAADVKNEEGLPPPPPPPPLPDAEPPSTDIWGTAKKDKKGKKGKTIEPEPAIVQVPDPPVARQEEAVEEDRGTFGLSAKDKKKKEKEKEKQEKEKKEREELEKKEKEEAERKEKEEQEKEKTKPGKKGKTGTATTSSKTRDLMAGSVPDVAPVVEDDFSTSMWGSTKKDIKKKSGKKDPFEVPPPVPTPPAQGLTPPPEDALDELMDDDWGGFGTAKDMDKNKKDSKKSSKAEDSKSSKTTTKEKADEEKAKVESASKEAKSFWGGMTTATKPSSKSKTTKEKASDKAKKEPDVEDDLDLDEIIDIVEEEPPPKKGSKSKTADFKLAKTSSKEEKASKSSASDKKAKADAEIDALIDFDDFDTKDSKSKTADAAKSKGDDNKADAWNFWGSSKKPSGLKGDEPRKEINKQKATNQSDPLAFLSNEPEASPVADEQAQSQPPKTSKSAMSASKISGKLSVAQKVKALEEEKKKASEPPAPPPVVEAEPPAKKTSAANKGKGYEVSKGAATPSKAAASASKKKDPSPPVEEEKKKSKDSVPGGFPDDEENLMDMLASSPVEKKSAKKGAKTAKTAKKESPRDTVDVDVPVVPVVSAVPAAPPTPPAEPVAAKSVKKERARVVRDQGASSWGFWGAAPKKDEKKAPKAKDDADMPLSKKSVPPPPGLARSKSTRTAKDKDKDVEKSSSSDTKEKKAESRPSKLRGSSFGAFFGGPPPARTKPSRRMSTSAASKTTSKRQSMDIDAFGLPSPPPEQSPVASGKAAKVMGTTRKLDRKASTKGKQKASMVPDPYPIDDDDMVMVNGIEDPIINAPTPKASKSAKDKSFKSKSRREPNPVVDAGDDIVMVDGPSQEDPEPLAFDERPRATLQRSSTSAKKPQSGKLMGLFGGFGKTRRNSDTFERPKSKLAITDDEALSPRKRTVNGREDSSKRIRRDDRKVRRPEKTDRDTEGFITDALNDGGAATELDEAGIRRQNRHAKRDAPEPDDRRARRRDADKEADDSRKAKANDRRGPRRDEDRTPKESTDRGKPPSSPPHKSDRRRSYMDPLSNGDRPKAHRSRTEQSSRKRHSVVAGGAVIDDYFDPRNAPAAEGAKKNNEPYMHGANDHTSSWVKSQISDPADPPPVEGTVIEPTPELGGKGGYAKDDTEDARRAARKARRQSRYAPDDEAVGDTDRERRRRRKEKGSEGSAPEWGGREREREKLGGGRRYTDMGAARLDGGRPSLGAAGKRGSWLKKVTGLGMG